MKTFVIADPHFGHKNIIQYCNRPFESVSEMDKALIDNWNKTVSNDDIIWVLGDFALASRDYTKSIIKSLRGRKRLILGNHDRYSQEWYREAGFEFVSPYPILIENFIILSHAPLEFLNENFPFFNIYGHVHNDSTYEDVTYNGGCVCVERTKYKPMDMDWIRIAAGKIKNDKNRWEEFCKSFSKEHLKLI